MTRNGQKKKGEPELITVQEAAQLRGVTRSRVHQWIQEGRLKKEVRYGRTVIDRDELLSIEPRQAGRPRKDGAGKKQSSKR